MKQVKGEGVNYRKWTLSQWQAKVANTRLKRVQIEEPGWYAPKPITGDFYTRPARVSEFLPWTRARSVYDKKVLHDPKLEAERIYIVPAGSTKLVPEERFDLYRLTFSYTHKDWDNLIVLDHKARPTNAKPRYNTPDCPRLGNEWEEILKHAAKQPWNKQFGTDRAPRNMLEAYRFVSPEVFLVPCPSPNKKAIFEFRRPACGQDFYIAYVGGVAPGILQQLLTDCHVNFGCCDLTK